MVSRRCATASMVEVGKALLMVSWTDSCENRGLYYTPIIALLSGWINGRSGLVEQQQRRLPSNSTDLRPRKTETFKPGVDQSTEV